MTTNTDTSEKKFTVIIEADTNDGDYITDINVMRESLFIRVKTLFSKANELLGGNWPRCENHSGEILEKQLVELGMSADDAESVSTWIPMGEYGYSEYESFTWFEGERNTL